MFLFEKLLIEYIESTAIAIETTIIVNKDRSKILPLIDMFLNI